MDGLKTGNFQNRTGLVFVVGTLVVGLQTAEPDVPVLIPGATRFSE
jgi:hypothetical protein